MVKKDILNSLISIGSYQAFIYEILFLAQSKIPSYVCFANVHMIIEAHCDNSFQKIVNEADLVAPDGRPLSVFLELSEKIKQDRICGMDLLPDLLMYADVTGKSVYFYGSTHELLEALIRKVKNEFPELKIAGYHSPPFRALSETEDAAITEMIRETHPDLVLVSLGCPKQEKWMAEHKSKIGSCLLGFGQAFRVYAGREKRLPKWMRNLSLEWVYRLYQEPGRLWKRYLYTNSYFLFLAIKNLIIRFFQNMKAGIAEPALPHEDHL